MRGILPQGVVADPRPCGSGSVGVEKPPPVIVEFHPAVQRVGQTIRQVLSGLQVPDPVLHLVGPALADGIHHESAIGREPGEG